MAALLLVLDRFVRLGQVVQMNAAAPLRSTTSASTSATQTAVDAVSVDVRSGELIVLLGPSGCGKTTTLRMIAGFVPPSAGDIRLDGASITALPPHRREMGIVFQSYALFPHLSVARNIAFGLEMRRMGAPAIAGARCRDAAAGEAGARSPSRLPRQLSGGQQQRVALARALAIHPRVLLLDEPLSNLDAALRQEMAREIRILQQRGGITTIMVTHDQTEAMALADRLVVMHEGRVQQIGTPEDGASPPGQSVRGALHRRQQHRHRPAEWPPPCAADGGAIALAGRYARRRRGDAGGPAGQRAAGAAVATAASRARWNSAPGLARSWSTWCAIAPDTTLLARGPGLGPDATPRHTAGTRVALRWGPDDERLFDAAGSTRSERGHAGRPIMRELTLSRRGVLGGAALLAAPAIIRSARAAEQCVVGTWGGDYARLLRENIDDPILKPAGIDVVQDIGDEAPRVAKLYAQKKLPRGSLDIACVGAVDGYRVNDAGLVEKLDEKQVPNLKHVRPDLRMPAASCHTSIARRCWCTTRTR